MSVSDQNPSQVSPFASRAGWAGRRHFMCLWAGLLAPAWASGENADAATSFGRKLASAARRQIGVTTVYDPAYVRLSYPGGDVPEDRGVCTDVVIRAFRVLGHDLQRLVHEDMAAHFSAYPKIWGLRRPDPNIDHRRVPNLITFFTRRGKKLPLTKSLERARAGDLVTCTVPPHRPHIMIVSDRTGADGRPLGLHNIGHGACEEDTLFTYTLTGHFRWE